MKLFKKSKSADQIADVNQEQTESAAMDEENQSEKVQKSKKPHDLKNALIRCGAALLAAVVLLAVTGFSIIDLIKGAEKKSSLDEEEDGSFVMCDIAAVFGTYGEDPTDYSYSVVPVGSKMVTVRFTKRYFDSAEKLVKETYNYVDGVIPYLDKYAVVQGTVEELDEEQSGRMYDWFAANKETMVKKGMIVDTEDAADYLSDKMLTVDTVNGRNQTLVLILTGLSLLFVLYIIAELVLMSIGFYKDKSGKNEADEALTDAQETDAAESDAGGEGADHEAPESSEDKE